MTPNPRTTTSISPDAIHPLPSLRYNPAIREEVMSDTITLSESAVANLRFRIKGFPLREQDLPAYGELVAAGITEPAETGAEYRFTAWGMEHREEILERASERIERERLAPPDPSHLSKAAKSILCRIVGGERVEIDTTNRAAFRELDAARIIYLLHTFAKGDESGYRFTYWGYQQRLELVGARSKG